MPAAQSRRTHPYSERYRIRRHERQDRCCRGRRSHAFSDQCIAVTTCACIVRCVVVTRFRRAIFCAYSASAFVRRHVFQLLTERAAVIFHGRESTMCATASCQTNASLYVAFSCWQSSNVQVTWRKQPAFVAWLVTMWPRKDSVIWRSNVLLKTVRFLTHSAL